MQLGLYLDVQSNAIEALTHTTILPKETAAMEENGSSLGMDPRTIRMAMTPHRDKRLGQFVCTLIE